MNPNSGKSRHPATSPPLPSTTASVTAISSAFNSIESLIKGSPAVNKGAEGFNGGLFHWPGLSPPELSKQTNTINPMFRLPLVDRMLAAPCLANFFPPLQQHPIHPSQLQIDTI